MPDTPRLDAPRADAALVDALRQDLAAAEYTVERIQELLGPVAAAALRRDQGLPARRRLAGSRDPAAILLALFTLGVDQPDDLVEAALPRLGVDGAVALGLLEPADPATSTPHPAPRMRARVDLAPYSATDDLGEVQWWIASDRSELATAEPLREDHVLGVGGASLTLARITPREVVGRVLDLGCGCGIQALHASRHAAQVVATDLSERALAFTALNAALNGISLDLRAGSLLEPVTGETFDLIVSNPPFVITPRSPSTPLWTYRDGGADGDTLLASLLHALPDHLAPGGRAVLLGNWEVSPEEPWDAHPRAWLDGTGLDAWIIQRETEDPAEYAETWVRDGGITGRDPEWDALAGAWMEDFETRDVAAIGFGYLLLSRPAEPDPGAAPVIRAEQVATSGSGSLGAHLAAGLELLRPLSRLDDDALLALRAVRAPDVVERRHLTPGALDPLLIEIVQGGGLGRTVRADQMLAATLGAADGELTLGQIIGAVAALTDHDPETARQDLAPRLRELLLGGLLTLPGTAGTPGRVEAP
ncbi:MAG: methyltransferase [Brachybacterium sp.]|nr:methyltransferase [Brachybacterium sp.]